MATHALAYIEKLQQLRGAIYPRSQVSEPYRKRPLFTKGLSKVKAKLSEFTQFDDLCGLMMGYVGITATHNQSYRPSKIHGSPTLANELWSE